MSASRPVELRSDTFTRPTPAMRQAMAEAEVGDDVYGEDPTVNELEAEVAALLGHEAALFVPSGTMGNQLGLRLLVAPGQELLCESGAHVVTYEEGAAAAHGGISTRTLRGDHGLLDPDDVRAELRPAGWGTVATRALAVEQTHNRGGGAVYPLEQLQALRAVCDERGVAMHADGARIWNAAAATGVDLAEYGRLFDTVSVCFSKGLGAPVGSALVTSAEGVARARPWRRRLGGAMRQAGVLAAAALHGVRHHRDRLADDHARAARLADVVEEVLPGSVRRAPTATNIVPVEVADARACAAALAEEGVRVGVVGPTRIRLLTHLDVHDDDVDRASDVLRRVLGRR